MTLRRAHELCEYHLLRDRFARPPFQVPLFLGATTRASDSAGRSQDVTWLTIQGTAQLFQDICTIHSGALVTEPKQSRVGHAGLLSQAINRPTFLEKNLSELADDHGRNLAGPVLLCQPSNIYELCFTYNECRSRVAPRSRRLCAVSVLCETTATNPRNGTSRTLLGRLSSADWGRT